VGVTSQKNETKEISMRFTRVYADATGESHYEDIDAAMVPQSFAPPAPPFSLSEMTQSTGMAFARFPVDWDGDWHPTPRRQYFIFLSCEFEGETSDGDRRRHAPGSVVLLEDTTGQGHHARVVGDTDVLATVVQLPD